MHEVYKAKCERIVPIHFEFSSTALNPRCWLISGQLTINCNNKIEFENSADFPTFVSVVWSRLRCLIA